MKISLLACIYATFLTAVPIFGMQPATPSLSTFHFNGASVLPYTGWPTKTEPYFLMAREAAGNDKGTYDAFGGRKDAGETHPVITAAREFSEETITLLGNPASIRNYIDLAAGNTATIVANYNKNFVVYITQFKHGSLEDLVKNFYSARSNANSAKYKEKDRLAWVRWSTLESAIANAKRDTNGALLPVTIWANVVQPNGSKAPEQITIRPVLVSCLQSHFNGSAYTAGHNSKIHFHQR